MVEQWIRNPKVGSPLQRNFATIRQATIIIISVARTMTREGVTLLERYKYYNDAKAQVKLSGSDSIYLQRPYRCEDIDQDDALNETVPISHKHDLPTESRDELHHG